MKTIFKALGAAVLVVIIAAAVVWGKGYYESRYVSTTYYAHIPANASIEPHAIYDDAGEYMCEGYEFTVNAVNEQGEQRQLEINIYDDDPPAPAPGSYLQVEASQQLVTGWKTIDQTAIPAAALSQLQP
jgi:uncharacterized protein (TIGR01655 family)